MSKTAHIAYILKEYPKISQTFIVNEIAALKRAGVKITILARENPGEGIIHFQVKNLKVPIYYLPRMDKELASVDRLLKDLGISHLHAHFAFWAAQTACLISSYTGIPFSFTTHAYDIYRNDVVQKELARLLEKAEFAITVTDFNKNFLEKLVKKEGKTANIIRIYNGIYLELFKYVSYIPTSKNPKLIVSVARLVEKKGLNYLIEACKILNDQGKKVHCLIIGDGEKRDELEKLINNFSLEKEVILLGAKPQQEVIKLIRYASVFVLPCIVGSDGNMDALPTSILEAMALGTPVISTSISGIPEIIKSGKEGLLVPPKNAHLLAYAINKLLNNPKLRQKLTTNAHKKVERDFNIEKNIRILKNYFTK